MKKWQKVVAIGAAMIVCTTGGVAVARTQRTTQEGPVSLPPGGMKAAFGNTSPTSVYTPITPCRIVDTRVAGGPVASNTSRNFRVIGTASFPLQGGKSGGCGIPTKGVSAIEVAVTAVDADDGGFMRIYPSGQPEPTATFINYSPFDPTNTGAVTICQGTCAGGQVTVKGHGSSTDVVMDVQGYYQAPLAARINGTGVSVISGSRVTGVLRTAAGTHGAYYVGFDRDVTDCSYGATVASSDHEVQVLPGNADNRVAVFTFDSAGGFQDSNFYLNVTC